MINFWYLLEVKIDGITLMNLLSLQNDDSGASCKGMINLILLKPLISAIILIGINSLFKNTFLLLKLWDMFLDVKI